MLDEFGLADALRWYAKGFTEVSGIHLELELPTDMPRGSNPVLAVTSSCNGDMPNDLPPFSAGRGRGQGRHHYLFDVRAHSLQKRFAEYNPGGTN